MARISVIVVAALVVACGGDGGGDDCLPQGRVMVGAAGTVGAPTPNFADCYAGSMPVVSLDRARSATADGHTLTFDDSGITAEVDAETCRISITYTFDSMLSDNTPASGTSQFTAGPDPDDASSWSVDADGSTAFEWVNMMGNTNECSNQLTGVVIAVEGS